MTCNSSEICDEWTYSQIEVCDELTVTSWLYDELTGVTSDDASGLVLSTQVKCTGCAHTIISQYSLDILVMCSFEYDWIKLIFVLFFVWFSYLRANGRFSTTWFNFFFVNCYLWGLIKNNICKSKVADAAFVARF